MSIKNKVAFIYLEEAHHLYHFISVAVALSEQNTVDVLTYENENGLVDKLLAMYPDHKVDVKRLRTKTFRRFTDKLKSRNLPRKAFWYKKNASRILKFYDAVIFTDYHHHTIKKGRVGKKPYLIKFSHGILGRRYAIKRDLIDFDFHLFTGSNMHTKLLEAGYDLPNTIVGHAKSDVVNLINHKPVFENNKITVIYAPHFSPPHSSWHEHGRQILNFFRNQEDYNLIFAPHINLFNKTGTKANRYELSEYDQVENIHIDLGSRKSVEMAYIKEADIYLGDASSQVLEFILNPRPCIFFNSARLIEYSKEFEFWKLGQVIDDISELPEALENAGSDFKNKFELQKSANEVNVYRDHSSSASQRYADAINNFLEQNYSGNT